MKKKREFLSIRGTQRERMANNVTIRVHTWNRPNKERKQNHQTYRTRSRNRETDMTASTHKKTRNGHQLNDSNLQDQLKAQTTDPSPPTIGLKNIFDHKEGKRGLRFSACPIPSYRPLCDRGLCSTIENEIECLMLVLLKGGVGLKAMAIDPTRKFS